MSVLYGHIFAQIIRPQICWAQHWAVQLFVLSFSPALQIQKPGFGDLWCIQMSSPCLHKIRRSFYLECNLNLKIVCDDVILNFLSFILTSESLMFLCITVKLYIYFFYYIHCCNINLAYSIYADTGYRHSFLKSHQYYQLLYAYIRSKIC